MVPLSDASPYPTLAPLGPEDEGRFCGRARKVQRLRDLLDAHPIVSVLGACGVGKSSLVRAGLWRSLRAELGDGVVVLGIAHPGVDPFAELSAQGLSTAADDLVLALHHLTKTGRKVVLICDHLEELLFAEPYTRQSLVDQLEALGVAIDGGLPVQLVLVAHGDALSALSIVAKGIVGLLERQALWLPALLEVGEWTEMVRGPARQAGLRVEDSMLQALGKDLDAYSASVQAGQRSSAVLPLLVSVLQRTLYVARLGPTPRVLSLDDYHSSGGLLRALPDSVESSWRSQPPALQQLQRRALLSLLHRHHLSEGEVLFSRPRRRTELLSLISPDRGEEPASASDVEAFSRLLAAELIRETPGSDIVELTHPILLSVWPELGRWPEEERRFESWHSELLAGLSREGSSLSGLSSGGSASLSQPQAHLGGYKLAEAERWLSERPAQIDLRVMRFIKASMQVQARRAQPAPAPPSLRRRWLPWTIASTLLLLMVGLLIERQRLLMLAARHADAIAAEQGARASLLVQQPGQDGAALALAIAATAPSLRSARPVPTAAKEGLMLTYGTAKNSLPLHGHTDRIELVAFDPTGELVLTGSQDQTARLWNARTGRQLRELRGHGGLLTTAVFSPDGNRVFTTSLDGLGRLWEVETGELKASLRGHTEPIEMGAFSALGDRIVTAGQDHTIRVRDAATGLELRVLTGHSERVPMAEFVPSGKMVVSGSFDQTVRLWDVSNGAELRTFRGHRHRVNLVAVSSDGQRAATGSWDGTVRLWPLEPGLPIPEQGVELTQGTPLHALQFSPDGSLIASAGADGVVKLWDGRTGGSRGTLYGHVGVVDALSFTSDGKYLVTAGHDRIVRLWDVGSSLEIAVLRGHSGPIYGVAVAPKGGKVATVSHDRTARIWDVRSGQPLLVLAGHSRYITASAFSPDGTRIATASHDHTAKLWKWPSGELVATLSGHEHVVNSVAFSADGTRIATASSDGTVRVWDGQAGRRLALLKGHKGIVQIVAFSPDGRRLLSGGLDETLRLWDITQGLLLRSEIGHHGNLMQATFSPDGKLLVTAGSEGETVIRDGATLAVLRTLPIGGQVVSSAVFLRTPQGQSLITAAERVVSTWDVATGQQKILLTLPSPVQMAVLSPSGDHLLVVGTDNSLLLWDMAAEMPLMRWPSLPFELSDANFAAPDGRYFLLSTADGKTLVYPDEYRSNLSGTLTDACNLLRYQPDFRSVASYCP